MAAADGSVPALWSGAVSNFSAPISDQSEVRTESLSVSASGCASAVTTVDVSTLHYGDNLEVLRRDIPNESVDLVYLDPPFNSTEAWNLIYRTPMGDGAKAQIQAFSDTWTWGPETDEQFKWLTEGGAPDRVADLARALRTQLHESNLAAYLFMMMPRLVELRRVLKPTGSLYLHCDPTASHYLKLVLDAVFGPTAFRNEIIWRRTPFSGSSKALAQQLPKSHDVILFYSKGDTWTWNPPTQPYSDEYLKRFKWKDARGAYRKTSLKTYSQETLERLRKDDRLIEPVKAGAGYSYKQYLSESSGEVQIDDLWTDINMLNPVSKERLGYPTQKPMALLDRIIAQSSNEGDVVLDPFCGCGTTIESAEHLKREWIGIDITYIAIDLIQKRLKHALGAKLGKIDVRGIPRDIESAHALFERNPFDFERWAVSMVDGQPNEKQVGDRGLDGLVRFPFDKDEAGKAIVSVKGGAQLGPAMVRDLVGTITTERAKMGILVLLDKPTRGMLEAAKAAGQCNVPLVERTFPKVQILTVAELLDGKRPSMPTPFLPYIKAKYRPSKQLALI